MITGDNGFAYDPDQDKEEKRKVRKDYRKEIEDAEQERANIAQITVDALHERVRRGDSLFAHVKNPSEAILDSHNLLLTSDIAAQKAKAMRHDANAFDTDEFINKLVTLMKGRAGEEAEEDEDEDEQGPLDWEIAGWRAVKRTRRVIGMDFMLGPLSVEQKKRAVQKRVRIERNKEDETRPIELTEADIERSENETTRNVQDVFEVLHAQTGSTNIFRLVINPHSFAQSVENVFYLSFSIRDGKVALEQDEETGEFCVYACEPPNEEDYADQLKKSQVVLELDMETWQEAIHLLHITEPLIPTRAAARTRLGDKWYG
ncbi:hypothetical protein DACRYDRAFT_93456 [Dacryopinax primogenitus]|uniref:Non-structural maintenance of chromosomes element 4 n=1 Tax=Dacryopinax primogenitus (strain DJM 731) TaxID=1858805 RepID=M5G6W7_DACPD|nr:uncharacterized protein DACRYDRAFT_93456 [Dacryopinax primogenitus]EJU03955.1 hypothetical protein DACRYDRAFT_93456 [Dacryopinax primogenitus]